MPAPVPVIDPVRGAIIRVTFRSTTHSRNTRCMRNERPRHRDEIPREDWDSPEELGHTWFEYAEELRDYVEKHKPLPPHTTGTEGFKIGSWINKQRRLGRAITGETLHTARRYYLETWVPEWEVSRVSSCGTARPRHWRSSSSHMIVSHIAGKSSPGTPRSLARPSTRARPEAR